MTDVCFIPGCSSSGKHSLGIRCRVASEPSPIPGKGKTAALWAPDTGVFLCDQHALNGAHIRIEVTANMSDTITTEVVAGQHSEVRKTRIRK